MEGIFQSLLFLCRNNSGVFRKRLCFCPVKALKEGQRYFRQGDRYHICGCFLLLWEGCQILFVPVFLFCLFISLCSTLSSPSLKGQSRRRSWKQSPVNYLKFEVLCHSGLPTFSLHYQKLQPGAAKSAKRGARRAESC